MKDTGKDGVAGIAPVGCFEANDFGLHDMIGNVWEWTAGTGATGLIKGGSYLCSMNYCEISVLRGFRHRNATWALPTLASGSPMSSIDI